MMAQFDNSNLLQYQSAPIPISSHAEGLSILDCSG
jgi:hypothetical protein